MMWHNVCIIIWGWYCSKSHRELTDSNQQTNMHTKINIVLTVVYPCSAISCLRCYMQSLLILPPLINTAFVACRPKSKWLWFDNCSLHNLGKRRENSLHTYDTIETKLSENLVPFVIKWFDSFYLDTGCNLCYTVI